ncbi:MAG: hypothetical protein ACD_46C00016G0001 [uncultured bacterium]|nr:MAG: hypothetical protein ACD_46C00016G0001 [uncultured bacterium]
MPYSEKTLANQEAHKLYVKTKIKGISVDEKIIHNIENKIKKIKLSLNSYLSQIILQSAAEVFYVKNFSVLMPINLRNGSKNKIPCSLEFNTSWINFEWSFLIHENRTESACIIHSNVKKSLFNKLHLKNLNLLNHAIENRKSNFSFLNSFISKNPTICISNLGVINKSILRKQADLPLQLIEAHASVNAQSYMGTSQSFTIQLCQLIGRGLFIDVNYPFPLVSDKKVTLFLDKLEQKLFSG